MIALKRAYDPPEESDGLRTLVDAIWPRGVAKEEARVDLWLKEVAPSKELRKWFGHDPERWDEFKERYAAQLEAVLPLLRRVVSFLEEEHPRVTLVFAAKDEEHNNAVALRQLLEGPLSTQH